MEKIAQNTILNASFSGKMESVYKLRYKTLRKLNAIPHNDHQEFSDEYDYKSNSTSYLYLGDNLEIGTIRASVYSEDYNWQPIPSLETYDNEIKKELGKKVCILESNRFLVAPEFQNTANKHYSFLFLAIIIHFMRIKPDFIITAVSSGRQKFYQKLFGLIEISKPKEYARLNVPPSILLAVDFETIKTKVINSFNKIPQDKLDHYAKTGILALQT